ncbi:hypothetical protein [Cryobacterium sp. CG_9.6]|uniref:hypothetical protein n=1 Tax=Cryobacterium sp. CG_9.6 TaxID=2760710 RepID=UPI002475E295|nr:hypothetical protein [Cryobacterium sp. CG_9.6]MDH6235361.1 hypothetical protein [Cryobacterium sp. CG_9.6]
MTFDYYVKQGIGRLFRWAPATNRQERWDDTSSTWISVAPYLADDIFSGRVDLDQITPEKAEQDYPTAFGERLFLTVDMMNRIQVAIAQKTTVEEFIADYPVPLPERAAVEKFYADLQKEMSESKLAPGQFWDVSSEWS